MNLKQLIKFGIEESSVPVIKNPILRAALEPRSAVQEPRNMAHGGRIGFRYGSSSFDAHTKREAAFKAYKDYKKSYYNSRQRNPIITFREFLPIYAKENFAEGGRIGYADKNAGKLVQSRNQYGPFTTVKKIGGPQMIDYDVLEKIIKDVKNGNKFVSDEGISKLYAEKTGQTNVTKRKHAEKIVTYKKLESNLIKKLGGIESKKDKISKVFNEILAMDKAVPEVDLGKYEGRRISKYRRYIIHQTGIGTVNVDNIIKTLPNYKNNAKAFKYLEKSGLATTDLINKSLSDQLNFAVEAAKGKPIFTGVKNINFADPNYTTMRIAITNWNQNNGQGNIKFYNKNGKLITWKHGLELNVNDVSFSEGKSKKRFGIGEKKGTLNLRFEGEKYFPEVYQNQNYINELKGTTVDNPFPGKKQISFSKLMKKVYMNGHGWQADAPLFSIFHGPEGVAKQPFKNLSFGMQELNKAMYEIDKIPLKGLKQKIINQALVGLKGKKGGDLLEAIVAKHSDIASKVAAGQRFDKPLHVRVATDIIEKSPEWMKWSSRKQAELFKVAGVSAKDFNALDNAKPNEKISMLKKMGFKCKLVGGAGESVDCYMKDVGETNKLAKQGNKQAIKKLGNAFDIGKELPKVGKLLRKGLQIGLAGPAKLLEFSGLGTWGGLLLEGALEGGVYKYYKDYKGYTDDQALAETFTVGLLAGRPEDVKWHGGAEQKLEKELYQVRDAEGNIRIKQNVKDFIDTQRNMDQIGTEYDKLESQKREIDEMQGWRSQYEDTSYAHPRLDPKVGIENKQKALENEYLKLEQLNKPDALSGNYNAWLAAKEKQDTEQGLRVAEAKKKRLGVVDIPWDVLNPNEMQRDYKLKKYEDAKNRWEKEQSEKRYREMKEKFPGYSDKQIDEILAYYETSQPEVGMSYGELKKRFNIGDKQAYFADNFRTEKAEGGIMNLKKKW